MYASDAPVWRGDHPLPRDPAGLPVGAIVDPARLREVVVDHLATRSPGVLVGDLSIFYARYKPGVGVQVGFEVGLIDPAAPQEGARQVYSLKAFGRDDEAASRLAKWETRRPPRPPFGDAVFGVPSMGAVCCAFPADSALIGLRVVLSQKAMHVLLTDRVLPEGERCRPHKIVITPVKYKPERRFVAHVKVGSRVEPTMERRKRAMYVRVYADQAGEAGREAAAAISAALPFVPTPLGHDPEQRVYLQEAREGSPLADRLGQDDAASRVEESAARLRELHDSVIALPRRVDRDQLLEGVAHDAAAVRSVSKDIGDLFHEVLRRLDRDRFGGSRPVPIHADFHDRQVLVGSQGVILLDLDDAAMGPAGCDVGGFLAHMRERSLTRVIDADAASRLSASFLSGYGVAPPDTRHHEALVIARLAARPLRNLLPDWERETEVRLRLALDLLVG